MKSAPIVGLLFTLIVIAKSESSGKACEYVKGITSLDKQKFLGSWFTVKTNQPDDGFICDKDNLNTITDDGAFNGATYTYYKPQNKYYLVNKVAKLKDNTDYTVLERQVSYKGKSMKGELQIVDTDYDNYLIGALCSDSWDKIDRIVLIATREKKPSADVLEKALASLRKHKLNYELRDLPQTC